MRNIKLGVKLLLAFGLVLLLVTASGIFSFYQLDRSSKQVNFVTDDNLSALLDEFETKESGSNLLLAVRTYRLTESSKDLETLNEMFEKIHSTLLTSEELLKKYPLLDIPKKYIPIVRADVEAFLKTAQQGVDMVSKKWDMYLKLVESRKTAFSIVIELRELIMNDIIEGSKSNDFEAVSRRSEQIRAINNIEEIMSEVKSITSMLAENKASKELQEKAIQQLKPLKASMEKLMNLIIREERKRFAKNASDALDEWTRNVTEFVRMHSITLSTFIDTVAPAQAKLAGTLAEYETLIIDRMKQLSAEATSKLYITRTALAISLIAAVISGVIIAVLFSRSISKPLQRVVSLAKRAETGDLTIKKEEFGYDGRDEIGMLVDAISSMVYAQAEVTKKVIDVARQVTDSSQTLAATSEETNASMEEIRAAVQEVNRLSESNAAAIEQSNAGVEEIASGASVVAKSSTEGAAGVENTGKITEKAVKMVDAVIDEMKTVGRKSHDNESQIRKLAESVEQISSFVSVITSIADQTNLLALNAAIEAARAGETGRGFAVVADEVRKLAEESGNAAKSVNQLISSLQVNAKAAINGTVESAKIIEDTLKRAGEAEGALSDSSRSIHHINETIQNIAAVAEEQAAASKEMALAIDTVSKSMNESSERINAVSQSTDGAGIAAENVAAAAITLNALAESLSNLLSHFKVSEMPRRINSTVLKE